MASQSTLIGRLEASDIAVIVVYFVVVIGFALWVSSSSSLISNHHDVIRITARQHESLQAAGPRAQELPPVLTAAP